MTDATPLASEQITQEQVFADAVWQALKADANDLRKQQRIVNAHRAALSATPAPSDQDASQAQGEALADVASERARQVAGEGWTPQHDDEHRDGSLAIAAATYALAAVEPDVERSVMDTFGHASATPYRIHSMWPWDMAWFKPKSRRADLVRAGALIIAEIERLDRMEKANG